MGPPSPGTGLRYLAQTPPASPWFHAQLGRVGGCRGKQLGGGGGMASIPIQTPMFEEHPTAVRGLAHPSPVLRLSQTLQGLRGQPRQNEPKTPWEKTAALQVFCDGSSLVNSLSLLKTQWFVDFFLHLISFQTPVCWLCTYLVGRSL